LGKNRFSGYELWRDGQKVDEYRPVTPGGAADPRSDELDAKLTELAPADELAYRYFYQQRSVHCRRDPLWKARIAELEGHSTPKAAPARSRSPPIVPGC
jgi:hypothetical protein